MNAPSIPFVDVQRIFGARVGLPLATLNALVTAVLVVVTH